MKERLSRLKAIRKIIKQYKIESQETLLAHLQKENFEVTQATLSRDLKLLKVGKIANHNGGYIYTLPPEEEHSESEHIFIEDFLRGYLSIDFSNNIVVIKTYPGHANTVCNAIDNLNLSDVLGTVAGDNCMFACLKEGVTGQQFFNELKRKIPELEE